jgi:hypothetical protein
MKITIRNIALVAACVISTATLPVQVEAKSDKSTNIIVALRGTSIGEVRDMEYGIAGDDDDALCFDLDIIDLKTGQKIGTAADCLSNIGESNGGLALVGRTIFNFPGGTLVTRGLTSVQPVTHGSPDFTHITGAIPATGENGVLIGTGRFTNASGPVRLSGAVNIVPDPNGDDPSELQITFDCIFDINLGSTEE